MPDASGAACCRMPRACAEEASAARLWVSLFDEPARSAADDLDVLERHRFSPQTFIPLEVSRYLVTVAPSDASGRPILSEVRAFIVGSGRGIVYRRGTWHSGMTVLDRPGAVRSPDSGARVMRPRMTNSSNSTLLSRSRRRER